MTIVNESTRCPHSSQASSIHRSRREFLLAMAVFVFLVAAGCLAVGISLFEVTSRMQPTLVARAVVVFGVVTLMPLIWAQLSKLFDMGFGRVAEHWISQNVARVVRSSGFGFIPHLLDCRHIQIDVVFNDDLRHGAKAKSAVHYFITHDVLQLLSSTFHPLDEQANTRKEKNFFETRVTEYQAGSLNWD